MKSQGLTFSLNDVNFDNSNLNLVPVHNNSESKDESINEIPQLIIMDNEVKQMNFESLNKVLKNTCDEKTHYEPVGYYWFYCVIVNGLAEWKPFSVKDSNKIEQKYIKLKGKIDQINYDNDIDMDDTCVPTDGGRYDVLLDKHQKVAVYWEEPPMETRRASWFYRPEDESFYLPYSDSECDQLEDHYRKCLDQNLWHQPFRINCSRTTGASSDCCIDSKFVFHSSNTMVEYRRYSDVPENMIKGRVVYRGVESFQHHLSHGESDHIDHMILVIPGIGSICDMSGRGIIECVNSMRSISGTLLQSHFPHYRQGLGRIEFLPVSWHSKFHQLGSHGTNSSSIDKDLGRISLKRVSKLRQFTNHTLIDVLCYSSLTHRQSILSIVASEMNRLRHLFVSRNPQYEGITISIAGHSLGSMIAFDLVTLQGNQMIDSCSSDFSFKPLEFEIGNIFALGSPISLLLTARGFSTLGSDFRLKKCKGGFFNIFHPFDPVAYLMEPMLVPNWQARPLVIPHHKGRKRLHLELKDNLVRVSHDFKTKLIHTLKNTWNSLQEFATAHKSNLSEELEDEDMINTLNKIEVDSLTAGKYDVDLIDRSDHGSNENSFIGQLNNGKRVDYVLQEAPLESFNEYLFALGSHACYWDSEDTILMMLKEIYSSLNIVPSAAPSHIANQGLSNMFNHSQPLPSITPESVPPVLPSFTRPSVNTAVLPPSFQNVQTKPFFQPNFLPEDLPKDELNFEINENKKFDSISESNNKKFVSNCMEKTQSSLSEQHQGGFFGHSSDEKETLESNFTNIDGQIDSERTYFPINQYICQLSPNYPPLLTLDQLTLTNLNSENKQVINKTENIDLAKSFSFPTETKQESSFTSSHQSSLFVNSFQPKLSEYERSIEGYFDETFIQQKTQIINNNQTLENIDLYTTPIMSNVNCSAFDKVESMTFSKPELRESKNEENLQKSPQTMNNIPIILRSQPISTFQPSIAHDDNDRSIDFYFTSTSTESTSRQHDEPPYLLQKPIEIVDNNSLCSNYFHQSDSSNTEFSFLEPSMNSFILDPSITKLSSATPSYAFKGPSSRESTVKNVQYSPLQNQFVNTVHSFTQPDKNISTIQPPISHIVQSPSTSNDNQCKQINISQTSTSSQSSLFVSDISSSQLKNQQMSSPFKPDFDFLSSTNFGRGQDHPKTPIVSDDLGNIGQKVVSIDSKSQSVFRKDFVKADSPMRMSPYHGSRSCSSNQSSSTVSSVFSSKPLIPKSGKIFLKK